MAGGDVLAAGRGLRAYQPADTADDAVARVTPVVIALGERLPEYHHRTGSALALAALARSVLRRWLRGDGHPDDPAAALVLTHLACAAAERDSAMLLDAAADAVAALDAEARRPYREVLKQLIATRRGDLRRAWHDGFRAACEGRRDRP